MNRHHDECSHSDDGDRAHSPPSPGWRPGSWRPLIWRDLRLLFSYLRVIETKIDNLGVKMSALDDALAALDAATNDVAAKLAANTAQIADLAAQLAAALPGSAEAAALRAQIDAAVASINSESERLVGLAADPANPVPEPVPTPEPVPAPEEPPTV